MASENRYLSYQVEGAWAEEAIHVKILQAGCGQEEPGSIMRVKLVAMNKSPVIAHMVGVWWNVIDVIVCLLVLTRLCCIIGIVCGLPVVGGNFLENGPP